MRTINNISAFPLACSLLLAGLPLSTPAFGQNSYIRIYTPTTPLPPGNTLNATNSMVTTSYYNSAGQLVQEVNHAATPQRKDQANLIVYDGLGRKTKEWQSVPFSDSDGSYKPIGRFNSSYAGFYHLDYKYEPSALRRPTEEIGRNSVRKGIKTEYLLNTDQYEELKVYRYSAYSNSDELYREGTYPEASLTCVKTTDEDSNANYLFYDSADRLILERRYNEDERYDTYYVYSPWDELICVLPPLASDGLADGRYNLGNTEVLKKYAYIYKYDRNGHRTGRKLPGAEWCYTIYDGDHRPVLEQTKKLYEKMAWTFRKYDGLGRIIIEGTAHEATYSEYLVDRYANILMKESYVGSSTAGDKYGYSGNAGPGTLRSLNPTVVYYYDTYDFLDLPLFSPLASATAPENGHAANMLPTGKYIATLDDSGGYELQVYYYDTRGRMVQADKYNSISRTTSHTDTEYNFTDSPLEITDRYVTPDVTAQRSITYQYDAAGRETVSNIDVSLQTPEGGTINKSYPLQQNSYDEFGRLQSKQLLNDKDVVTVDYGQDGKLHELNNRHFSQKLHYSELDVQGKHYYNGLISGLSIRQGGNSYRFELNYDALGRYTSSGMYDYEGDADLGWSEFFQYDKMGNMNMIGHRGPLGTINALSLNYDGNHVNGVNNHNSYQYPPYEYAHMFCDWYSQADGYAYDGNGNEVKNMAAHIYHAKYNDLNLPDSVLFRFSGNTANFTYLGDGRRIRSVYKTYNGGLAYMLENTHVFNDPNYVYEKVKDGDLEFKDGKLTKMDIPNGYIKTVGDNGEYTLDARYFLMDYLGSIRTVCDAQSGNALDNIEYLPSGMAFRTGWSGEQNLHFCGKEELTMHGYNVYDSGARFQYSRYPRFLSMDPLAEKYYS